MPQTPKQTHDASPTASTDDNEGRYDREDEVEPEADNVDQRPTRPRSTSSLASKTTITQDEYESFANGYHFPPRRRWQESLKLGSIAFLKYSMTPLGFAVVLYGLLVVAFGGMLFLLLCNAAPAMCSPTCDDINSPRRIWIEIDAQVLNALFCITGFGLAPWRFRDLYHLLRYRLRGDLKGLRRLAGIHRDWFRLTGSQMLPAEVGPHNACQPSYNVAEPQMALPDPVEKAPDAPYTGIRAPPTKPWKMDYVVWMFVANTAFQCLLAGFQWGMNRYTRPSWATGLFVVLGMVTGALAGWTQFSEGRAIKHIEGVAVTPNDIHRLANDRELGILHYNNLKAKKPKNNEDKLSMHHRLNKYQQSCEMTTTTAISQHA